ncbi:MAG TPA: tRNA (adenosine(37)-N6)-threonylcarbamoyltransferase complex transferase subunit TsaD [Chitinophagaceae bacterium]|nr:tRNA (adenosine(37)-N6)-threonylcarbamoyltransferase complex transferase subunit TsaD [Chitinophagaceae bacterium]
MTSINILAIETSCDETAASVISDGIIRSNEVAGQDVHIRYGGVVPELASRAHEQHIVPVVEAALTKASLKKEDLSAVAFTQSPGLIGALLVGSCFAKALAFALGIPLIAVQHLQAHVLANFIDPPFPHFPFLCLTVSGGHTQIIRCENYLNMQIIGQTTDDAAGEAFDKTARLLGLPYPGGPHIDRHALLGNPDRFSFPEPRVPGLDFSFSGLKTAILYFIREKQAEDPKFISRNLDDICASVQSRIISILMHKLEMAAAAFRITEIAIAGGVSANSGLRESLRVYSERNGWNHYIPQLQYCTDNAAMIAVNAHFKYLEGQFSPLDITPAARALFP